MIVEQGDGSIAQRMKDGKCPKCRSEITVVNGEFTCKVCNLIIQERLFQGTADKGWRHET